MDNFQLREEEVSEIVEVTGAKEPKPKSSNSTAVVPVLNSSLSNHAFVDLQRAKPPSDLKSFSARGSTPTATLTLGRAGSAMGRHGWSHHHHHSTSGEYNSSLLRTTAAGILNGGSDSPGSSSSSMALSALDLDSLPDLRNLDPALAQRMLDEIHRGADIKGLLEKFRLVDKASFPASSVGAKSCLRLLPPPPPPKRNSLLALDASPKATLSSELLLPSRPLGKEKMVTFEDEAKAKGGKGDIFM